MKSVGASARVGSVLYFRSVSLNLALLSIDDCFFQRSINSTSSKVVVNVS
jgi:hypothetical protein